MTAQLEIIKKASILIQQKKFAQANDYLLNYVKNSKNTKLDIKLYYTLYLATNGLKKTQLAKKYLEKCLKINENNHIILNNLANLYLKEGNFNKAEKFYLKSYNLKNEYLLVVVNLAILYQNIGKLEEAKKFYLKAIDLSPKRISIYFNLSRIDKNYINDEKIIFLSELMKKENQEPAEMSYGYFLLAENERKKKNIPLEIDYLKKANQYSFDSIKAINQKTLNYWKNVIPKKYNKFQFINKDTKNQLKNFKPFFIVGLPRSGSTITEALLTSNNKDIISLGESSLFNGIIAKEFSDLKNNLVDLDFIRKKILDFFINKNINSTSRFFVDKSLENFFYMDVIVKIFPKAIFINTTRNIEDNIFAIFKQSLSKLSWTHSIDNILDYMDNYFRIINYFEKKYDNKIFSIKLEDITNKMENTSKELYDFCNLKWSKNILNFNSRKDLLISTASNIQIRSSIKKYDDEKYKPYKSLLRKYFNKYQWLNEQ